MIKLKDLITEDRIDEADHRREAWDVLQKMKNDLMDVRSQLNGIPSHFPLKGSQVSLNNSAQGKIREAAGWIDKLMKDIARG